MSSNVLMVCLFIVSCLPKQVVTRGSSLQYSDSGDGDMFDFRDTVPPYACDLETDFYESIEGIHPCPRILSAYVVGNKLFPRVGNSLVLFPAFALLRNGGFSFEEAEASKLNRAQIEKLGNVMNKLHRRHKVRLEYHRDTRIAQIPAERLIEQWSYSAMRRIRMKLLLFPDLSTQSEANAWEAYWQNLKLDAARLGYWQNTRVSASIDLLSKAIDEFVDYFIMRTAKEGSPKAVSGKFSLEVSEIYHGVSKKTEGELFEAWFPEYVSALRNEFKQERKNFAYPVLTEFVLEYFISCFTNSDSIRPYGSEPSLD